LIFDFYHPDLSGSRLLSFEGHPIDFIKSFSPLFPSVFYGNTYRFINLTFSLTKRRKSYEKENFSGYIRAVHHSFNDLTHRLPADFP
jgi:hypothetical protein